jgi:superfamily II DNA or RNA helicase
VTNLIIQGNRCRLEGEDDHGLLWALDRELSYNVMGAQFTQAYKRGYMDPFSGQMVNWDGKNRLMDDSNMSFPIGLKQRVLDFYQKINSPIFITDNRPVSSSGSSIDISQRLKEMNRVPRSYQIAAMEAAKAHDYGIIRAPTGSGKTAIAAMITAALGKKTIIYVIGKDLLYQFHKFCTDVFQQKIGIIGDGLCEISDINIISIWTIGQALGLKKTELLLESDDDDEKVVEKEKYKDIRELLLAAKVHILDECHIASCATVSTIAQHINPEHLYGMSASPWRDDGSDLLIEALLGNRIIDISAKQLIKQGYLVQPYIKFINVPPYPEHIKKHYQTIYKTYIIENEIRNNLILQNAEKLVGLKYKPLVLFKSIDHGKRLFKLLSQHLNCVLLSGKDDIKKRNKAKENIESGKIDLIIASKIFDIGLDVPILSALINCGGGKASVPTLQRVGRVIRTYPNKKVAAVVDFSDNAHYLRDHSENRKKILQEEFGLI